MKPALVVSLLILAIGLAGLLLVIRQQLVQTESRSTELATKMAKLPREVSVPVFVGDRAELKQLATLSATAIQVEDRDTGAVLFARQADQLRYPASTAKMMTAIVARQIYDLDTPLTIREEAFADGSSIGFVVGEQLTVRDLLAILLIHSGNDAAFVLANNSPGGYSRFIELMNVEARRLGLSQTTFTNASGLDDPNQQTTAADLATISSKLLDDEFLAQLVRTKYLTVSDTTGRFSHPLVNRHELLGVVPGVIGVKTGTTESAGENLVTALQRDNRQTLLVMLESQQRYPEMIQLINWINQHYDWQVVTAPPHP